MTSTTAWLCTVAYSGIWWNFRVIETGWYLQRWQTLYTTLLISGHRDVRCLQHAGANYHTYLVRWCKSQLWDTLQCGCVADISSQSIHYVTSSRRLTCIEMWLISEASRATLTSCRCVTACCCIEDILCGWSVGGPRSSWTTHEVHEVLIN